MDPARFPPARRLPGLPHPRGMAWAGIFLLAVLAGPAQLRAQVSPEDRSSPVAWRAGFSADIYQSADRLLSAGEAGEALAVLEEHLAAHPDDVEARWRAAKAATLVGVLSPVLVAARPWYRAGIAHSDSALSLEPENPNALIWSMVSKGRLALWTSPGETADLGEDVWELGHRILEDDDAVPLAHYGLGVLNYEVAKMSAAKRFLARIFLGGEALSQTSWDQAFYHLKRSISLEPDNKLFRLAYAKALEERGRVEESVQAVEAGLALPVTNPLEGRYQYLLTEFFTSLDP